MNNNTNNIFLKNNLIGINDGEYKSANITVNVSNGRIVCTGTTGDASETVSIPIENISISGKYNFSIQNILKTNLAFPTVFLDNNSYQHITHIYGISELSYITFETSDTTIASLKLNFTSNSCFDIEFNLMLQEGEIRYGYTPYNESIDKAELLAEYADDVVHSKMFGAVGDGITDDTVALQCAIDFALKNKKKLFLDSGKVYLISNTLNFYGTDLYFDGQNSTIKIDDNISTHPSSDGVFKLPKAICINVSIGNETNVPTENGISEYYSSTYISRIFTNLKLDCNIGTANYGIYIENGFKTHFSNIMVCDPASYGIEINQGSEAVFDNIHVTRSKVKDRITVGGSVTELDRQSVGINIQTADTYIHDCVAIDFKTGFLNNGSDNHYARCHPWNLYTQNIINKSIGFDIQGGYTTFSQCIADSVRYGWVLRNNAKVCISNCCNTYSPYYVQNKDTHGEPVLFYFDKSDSYDNIPKGSDLIISSSYFKTADNLNCHFDNLEETDEYIIIDKLSSQTFTDTHISEAVRTHSEVIATLSI